MSADEPGRPWDRTTREHPKSGLVYPVNQREVAEALRQSRARVGAVHFVVHTTGGRLTRPEPPGTPVANVEWQDASNPLWHDGGDLWIFAVPFEQRDAIHGALIGEGLLAIASWLAFAAVRGALWREMRHERWLALAGERLSLTDFEGADWTTMRRI